MGIDIGEKEPEGILEISPEDLYLDVCKMEEKIFTLDSCIHTMYEELTALSAMWKGEAHEAFCIRFEEECLELTAFCVFLTKLRVSMEEAAIEYQRCEQEVKELTETLILESEDRG